MYAQLNIRNASNNSSALAISIYNFPENYSVKQQVAGYRYLLDTYTMQIKNKYRYPSKPDICNQLLQLHKRLHPVVNVELLDIIYSYYPARIGEFRRGRPRGL